MNDLSGPTVTKVAANSDPSDLPLERRVSPTGVVVVVPVIRATASGRVDEKQAAAYLGCSTRWLRMRRERDELPDYERYCGRIWYRLDALDAFQELSKHETSR